MRALALGLFLGMFGCRHTVIAPVSEPPHASTEGSGPRLPGVVPPERTWLLEREGYRVSLSRDWPIASWVSWTLEASDLGSERRSGSFLVETDLPPGFRALRPGDYRGSGFDRGHLCPSADRTANPEKNRETFRMANIHPQTPSLNRGPWKDLEEDIRGAVRRGQKAWIVAGGSAFETRGQLTVPRVEFKVALIARGPTWERGSLIGAIGVIFPNDAGELSPWTAYAVAIDRVEELTGEDFFAELDDALEAELEAASPGAPFYCGDGYCLST